MRKRQLKLEYYNPVMLRHPTFQADMLTTQAGGTTGGEMRR